MAVLNDVTPADVGKLAESAWQGSSARVGGVPTDVLLLCYDLVCAISEGCENPKDYADEIYNRRCEGTNKKRDFE